MRNGARASSALQPLVLGVDEHPRPDAHADVLAGDGRGGDELLAVPPAAVLQEGERDRMAEERRRRRRRDDAELARQTGHVLGLALRRAAAAERRRRARLAFARDEL